MKQSSTIEEDTGVLIIGAGPAGLAAGYELTKKGRSCRIVEMGDKVGGIARTESYKGYRFDIGGHRFYTKIERVQKLWESMLGAEFIKVSRCSRIYYKGVFFDYPLALKNVIGNLGLVESIRILLSYIHTRVRPLPIEETFEQWVINRFGKRLYQLFFKTYTEKVWGIPCSQIRADWAAQRIQNLSVLSVVSNALFGTVKAKSLINEFHYPRLGPGQMWEVFKTHIERAGNCVQLGTEVVRINHNGTRVLSIEIQESDVQKKLVNDNYVSTMPLSQLIKRLDPPAPKSVLDAANQLEYRDFIIVVLISDKSHVFPDNWIYVHSPEFKVGRIQNFKNWSMDMVPDASTTSLGMEYFCSRGDALWGLSDAELIELAKNEIAGLSLLKQERIFDAYVIRECNAYPVYDCDYRKSLDTIRQYLPCFDNLQTIGRNGLHRYNNQDHSILAGLYAAQNIMGDNHDVWDINVDRSYYEEQKIDEKTKTECVGRSVPSI